MLYWEDFTVGRKMEFGALAVTEEDIIEYAAEFDPQLFHVDKEAASKHYFGGLIASGWQTAALCMRMMVDGYLNNSSSMGSPGVEQLRWKSPVRPGETLHVVAEITDRSLPRSKPELGFVKFSHVVYNEQDEVKMTMISSGMFLRKPSKISVEEGSK